MIAMLNAGVEVEAYDAYEIDKYAIQTAQHNFHIIREHGDVFKADFTDYLGVDFLVGGSPCTYWSIAQTKNRETVASGMGWELFSQYVRALREAKPKYFIYENNKSMSKEIRKSITETFGFDAICINSALVSAQNRQRLYWVGKRNADGTYSKVNVEQPEDRGILLKDVLDSAFAYREKSTYAEPMPVAEATKDGFTEIQPGDCVDLSMPNSKTRRGRNMSIKANCLQTSNEFYQYCGTVKHPIYEVKDGQITIKEKQYPIKLKDGYYIIRKLTVNECKRLQTVPEWYEFPVSDSKAYKMLGNGWTCDVITHLIKSCLSHSEEEYRTVDVEYGLQYSLF